MEWERKQRYPGQVLLNSLEIHAGVEMPILHGFLIWKRDPTKCYAHVFKARGAFQGFVLPTPTLQLQNLGRYLCSCDPT